MNRFLFLLLAILLAGCESGPQPGDAARETASITQSNEQKQAAEPEMQIPEPEPEALARADRIIAYSNRAHEALEKGHYSLADRLYENSRRYLENWSLPATTRKLPRFNLKPEEGLFDEKDARLVTEGLLGMDRSLADLLGHYANLEKYVANPEIRDDGKQGRALAARIRTAHESFIAARRTWLEIVQARAAEAQELLLYRHPLQRQIMAGNDIFAQIGEVTHLLGSGSPQTELLRACRQNIEDLIALGAKPPFPARPALERLYRAFLKQAQQYLTSLERGLAEGFYQVQKKELNLAGQNCAAAWNLFAREANGS